MEAELEDDEDFDDEDVSGPPDPGWLLEHLLQRLDADGLLDTDHEPDGQPPGWMIDSNELLGTVLTMEGEQPDASGRYPPRAFSYASHLGARYLVFLQDEPTWPPPPPDLS